MSIIYVVNRGCVVNKVIKNEIIMCFEEIILPFWQSEVEDVVVEGKGYAVYGLFSRLTI